MDRYKGMIRSPEVHFYLIMGDKVCCRKEMYSRKRPIGAGKCFGLMTFNKVFIFNQLKKSIFKSS